MDGSGWLTELTPSVALALAGGDAGGSGAAVWWDLLARLHPLTVHFPIALIVVALGVEALHAAAAGMRTRRGGGEVAAPSPAALACLALGAVSAGLAAWSGWTNADLFDSGGAGDLTVALHRWIAIGGSGVAAFALVLGLVGRVAPRAVGVYRLALLVGATAIGVAGHFGGSITHGEGYLLAPFRSGSTSEDGGKDQVRAPMRAPDGEQVERTVDFARDIQPIFEAYCYECHGVGRQRGRLRLDTEAGVARREVIVVGDPSASELFVRMSMAIDDPDVMPPDDRTPRPTDAEIALVAAWITQGAAWDASAVPLEARGPDVVADPGEAAEPTGAAHTQAQLRARDSAIDRIEARGGTVAWIAEDSPDVEVHLELVGDLSDGDLAMLEGLESTMVWLSVAGTDVTDAGLAHLSGMLALRTLHLERTGVGDAGVRRIASLPALQMLNLHSTGVTDAGLESLVDAPALERVYVWNTGVTPGGVELFEFLRPEVAVSVE